jgi:hypothetical protein
VGSGSLLSGAYQHLLALGTDTHPVMRDRERERERERERQRERERERERQRERERV